MTTFSPLRAVTSCLPVIGPVVGFFNRFEKTIVDPVDVAAEEFFTPMPNFEVNEARHIYHQYKVFYAQNAAIGSILTVITALALAALGVSTAPKILFALGIIALIDNVQVYNRYQTLCEVEQEIGTNCFTQNKPPQTALLNSAAWIKHRATHNEYFERLMGDKSYINMS